jgi:beta-glucosidase/6-phospho-beta-glucosidase/beta-galactosidase
MPPPLFDSFFMAGFECSSHRRKDMVRLDLIRRTGHDRHALSDYRHCARLGLRTVRDGLRWHLIETAPNVYDWSSWVPMLEAAAKAGVQVIWDIFHYGSPDHLDKGSPEFIDAYARFAAESVRVHRSVVGAAPLVCPINEISFFTWAVNTGYFPRAGPRERGWFKRQLVRAAIAGVLAMRSEEPDCRFVWAEPLIHVVPRNRSAREKRTAEEYRQGQFEAYDLLTGRSEPELGGNPSMVDAVGLNFYPDNQWYYQGGTVPLGHYEHRALSEMLAEVWERYGKPILISETGAEGAGRAAWLHYVCAEVRQAMAGGVRVEGVCLYPVTAYPGWDNSRHAEAGLFSSPHPDGERTVYKPLAEELERQRRLLEAQ